jgi:hypothetical protein
LHELDTLHLHIDLGGRRDALRDLCGRLERTGATPKETLIAEQAAHPAFSFDDWAGHRPIPAPRPESSPESCIADHSDR